MTEQTETKEAALIRAPDPNDAELMVPSVPQGVEVPLTPAQARVESVAAALDAAYKNASNLKLTPEEAKALEEDFPDEAFRRGAGGDDRLIYIEHAYLRQRLNKVLGIGAATPIRRREWAEEFTYWKDNVQKKGVRVYVDLALLVRGCLVGEAIGDAIYYPDNAKTTYSDALESAKSNAFRRCCKELGVGLQAWMKGWCEGWEQRNGRNASRTRQEPRTTSRPHPPQQNAPQANVEGKKAASSDVLPKAATELTREWALRGLCEIYTTAEVNAYFAHRGWMQVNDALENWPLEHVPTSKEALNKLAAEIGKWLEPQQASDEGDGLPQDIASVVISVPRKGQKRAAYLQSPDTIGSLYAGMKAGDKAAQSRLWGLALNYVPEGYQGRPPSQEDLDCREGLDRFVEWERKKKGDSGHEVNMSDDETVGVTP